MLSLVQRVTLSSLLLSKPKYSTSTYQKLVSQITIIMIVPPPFENVKMTKKRRMQLRKAADVLLCLAFEWIKSAQRSDHRTKLNR